MSGRFSKVVSVVYDVVCIVHRHESVRGRFQRVNKLVHQLWDWVCWADEEPGRESELKAVRKMCPLALRLVWALWTYR
jgi:hypothetical protein